MKFLSSNHFSHDDQVRDVVNYLQNGENDVAWRLFLEAFPEWSGLTFDGAWLDAEASGVDLDYMPWVSDWLEANTSVVWNDGEPVIYEDGDDLD